MNLNFKSLLVPFTNKKKRLTLFNFGKFDGNLGMAHLVQIHKMN